ncbi:MAG: hypothetical protein H7Z41_08850 [Cytophagales bacterium]|nr:hypothetical protein [Armatimonadota bacterium]
MILPITIAAPILARTESEAQILLQSVRSLARQALPLFFADGGSIPGFREDLAKISRVTVRQTPGEGPRLVSQVRQALDAAQETRTPYILYTEPDKQWFFENRLETFLSNATTDASEVGIYLPARDAASFATFPRVQQTPEQLFNALAAETLGRQADLLYGPLLLRRDLVPLLDPLPPDLGWGWRTFLVVAAHRHGLPLVTWEADLPCPEEQRGEGDEQSQTYRLEQLAQNIRGLVLGRKELLQARD